MISPKDYYQRRNAQKKAQMAEDLACEQYDSFEAQTTWYTYELRVYNGEVYLNFEINDKSSRAQILLHNALIAPYFKHMYDTIMIVGEDEQRFSPHWTTSNLTHDQTRTFLHLIQKLFSGTHLFRAFEHCSVDLCQQMDRLNREIYIERSYREMS